MLVAMNNTLLFNVATPPIETFSIDFKLPLTPKACIS
jgi:hypothetical protein